MVNLSPSMANNLTSDRNEVEIEIHVQISNNHNEIIHMEIVLASMNNIINNSTINLLNQPYNILIITPHREVKELQTDSNKAQTNNSQPLKINQ